MKKYLMQCGHISMATDENLQPVCAICYGINDGAKIVIKECIGNEGLEGRKAKCLDCGKITDSSWNLAFFAYRPNDEYDTYYNGCYGWS